ncbi:MAG TPA: hypothetical protein O0X23_02615 [Methanocorpusculum sp.]|nr:hypothetical protein [Methanocorpusculum sp.]
MKLKILSLVLIIMLVSFPVTPVMATSIQEDCQKAVTEDDLKTYIKHHVIAGHEEHCAFVLLKERKFDTSEECHNPSHEHMRLFSTIRVKDVCKIQYKCLDQNGDKWRIDIEGKIGDSAGLCWICDEEKYWNKVSPCATYGYSHTYDLNEINSTDLLQLFNLMISVDQYLDATGMDVLIKLAKNVVEGGTDIAGTLVAVAKWGGQNPLYG